MYIKSIKAVHFRNYEALQLELHPRLNIFVGENAQGKTNIIEMIYLSAMGKSFRTFKDQEMIQLTKQQAYTKVEFQRQAGPSSIEIKLDLNQKKIMKVNQVVQKRTGELLGNLNVVIFSPDDLKIVKEGPSERRKFIDNEISQIYPKYYHTLNQYNRVLQQRNRLLKEYRSKKADLEIWDEQLVKLGTLIMVYRMRFIKRISILARLMHRKITNSRETLDLIYESNIPYEEKDEPEQLQERFRSRLGETFEQERKRGLTMAGPHRDDLLFLIHQMDVRNYGSQGQKRTAVLSLKLAELELIKGEVGEYPILLLDDVMSELDVHRQRFLVNGLKQIQILITATMLEQVTLSELDQKKVFSIGGGAVLAESF